jgi:hypothetical protein
MADETEKKDRTIRDYVFGCVNFPLPDEAVDHVLSEREIEGDTALSSIDKKDRELLKADLYVWICMGPTKQDSVSDSDNGWKHSEGGYTLSDDDKDRMLAYAKAIYDKYDEEYIDDSVSVHVSSFGIMPCNYNEAGFPLPHVE